MNFDTSSEYPWNHAREGVFDAQLSFPEPLFGPPETITAIIKRDGREAPFERRKIAAAIHNAAESIGEADADRADSLASAVTLYLTKQLSGEPPTVEQVHDAVERVLIELGHARIALAYARYRERRNRIQRLQDGDLQVILGDLDEARKREAAAPKPGGVSLFVRTSDERIVEWDRERIAEALVRETEIEPSMAALIALEVERQIAAANVKTLTAALVRELAGAKLLEYGLEEQHRRHMRLGAPLYDAERIICRPNADGGSGLRHPGDTDAILAGCVKREYALSRVFSQGPADAHLRGSLHIRGLSAVDRLRDAAHPAGYVARFGPAPDASPGKPRGRPPAHAFDFAAQWGQFAGVLANFFQEPPRFPAANMWFAPFLAPPGDGATGRSAAMEEGAHALLSALAHWGPPGTALDLAWATPSGLAGAEAVGPRGAAMGESWEAYEPAAQETLLHLLGALRQGPAGIAPYAGPELRLILDAPFFDDANHEACLHAAASAIAAGAPVTFGFQRGAAASAGANAQAAPAAAQAIALNLPRLAAEAGHERLDSFLPELDALIGLAAQGHHDKRLFVEKLASLEGLSPLAWLLEPAEGLPYIDVHGLEYRIEILGLSEALALLLGDAGAYGAAEREDAARRIARRVRERCADLAAGSGMAILPGACDSGGVARRFAAMDLQQGSAASRTARSSIHGGESTYTRGAALPEGALATPMDRLRWEGLVLAELGAADAPAAVTLPGPGVDPGSIARFVRQAHNQTLARGLRFTVPTD